MSLIEMQNINKIYKLGDVSFQALYDIDLTVEKGEFLAILGPSGSGKSTLMNIIGCLDVATSGDYYLDNIDITYLGDKKLANIRNEKIGFIFQNFNLLPRLSALDNIMLPLIYARVPHEERIDLGVEMLDKVGLLDKADNFPRQLSGGQQQRIAIARAIVTNPSIVLADEPTGALDQNTGRQIIKLLKDLNAEGKTIIMITHDEKIALEANRIVRILDGRINKENANV